MTITNDFFAQMLARMQAHMTEQQQRTLQIPPPIFKSLGGEVVEFDDKTMTLVNKYPVEDRFRNPMGFLQGGIIVSIMDNTIGPLSMMIAPPSVTTQFNTNYLRPVISADKFVIVTAQLTERTRRQLFFTATASNEAGKTLTIGHAVQQIIEG